MFHFTKYPLCFFSPNFQITPKLNICHHPIFYEQAVNLRIVGLGKFVGICGFLILFITTLLVFFNIKKNEIYNRYIELKQIKFIKLYTCSLFLLILLVVSNFIINYLSKYNFETSFNLNGSFKDNNKILININSNILFLNVIAFILAMIGAVEVLYGMTYSFTLLSTGETVYRAAATFMNPNLYALWLVSVYFILAYVYWIVPSKRTLLIIPMFLITCSIYLTGSRGVFLIFLFCMIVASILLPKNKSRFWPIIIFIVSFLTIYFTSVILLKLNIGTFDFTSTELSISRSAVQWENTNSMNYAGVNGIVNLGDRFLIAPTEVISYIIVNFRDTYPWFDDFMYKNFDLLGQFFNDRIRSETKLSLDLRFNLKLLEGGSGDSGWLGVIEDYGFITALIIFLQHILLLSCGIRLYIAEKNINSSIVIIIQLFLILINFIIKFYAFPFIIILSMLQLFSILLLIHQTLIYKNNIRFFK